MVDFGPMPEQVWVFNAKVEDVTDGDTFDMIIDAGFHDTAHERLRLWGINAWESKGPERPRGLEATRYLANWLIDHTVAWKELEEDEWPFRVQTIKGKSAKEGDDVFGRYLMKVWSRATGESLNAELLTHGHAREDVRP